MPVDPLMDRLPQLASETHQQSAYPGNMPTRVTVPSCWQLYPVRNSGLALVFDSVCHLTSTYERKQFAGKVSLNYSLNLPDWRSCEQPGWPPGSWHNMWATVLKQQSVGVTGGWLGTGHRGTPPTHTHAIPDHPLALSYKPLIGSSIRQVAVGPRRPDPSGGLGQADPNPQRWSVSQGHPAQARASLPSLPYCSKDT